MPTICALPFRKPYLAKLDKDSITNNSNREKEDVPISGTPSFFM
jgi:hypothetical protein